MIEVPWSGRDTTDNAGFLSKLALGLIAAAMPAFFLSAPARENHTTRTTPSDRPPEPRLQLNRTSSTRRAIIRRRQRIDLNRADRTRLRSLPGIGPAMARRIVEHRKKQGPFENVGDLLDVNGVGPGTLGPLRHRLRVDPIEGTTPDDRDQHGST